MKDKSTLADNKTDWLTALDFVCNIRGPASHLEIFIYDKKSFLHDFGSYWVLYIELKGDFCSVDPEVFMRLCSILAAGKEYKQTGIFYSNKKWYLCQLYSKNSNHRVNISLVIIQHTLAKLIDKRFDTSEVQILLPSLSTNTMFSEIGKIV